MKISILTPDISNNCFGRAWLLAKLLQANFETEIIGPAFGNGIWKPLQEECDFPIKIIKGYPNGLFKFNKMLSLISGDVIYSSKPLMASFGIGLVKRFLSKKPLLLDIDDWELGFGKNDYDSLPWHKTINNFRLSILNLRSYYYSLFLNKLISLSDAVTTSGKLLQKKYGGTVIWHGRNPDTFDPSRYNIKKLREKYLEVRENAYIVSFIGTPREHKGLDDLIVAIEKLNDKDIILLIVGVNESSYCNRLLKRISYSTIKENTRLFQEQPFEVLPEYLAISDLVVIPQRNETASYGQVPAKLFDAMAMAKPIISTRLYDIPFILEGCGWVIKPGDPNLLSESIAYVRKHPEEALNKGIKARKKMIKYFSWDVLTDKLAPIIEQLNSK